MLVSSVTFRPFQCWGRQQEFPPISKWRGSAAPEKPAPTRPHPGLERPPAQRRGGRCFPWSPGRRAFLPLLPASPTLPAGRCGNQGFPYPRPSQLRAHTELQRAEAGAFPLITARVVGDLKREKAQCLCRLS